MSTTQSTKSPLIGQGTALFGGFIATFVVGVPVALYSVWKVFDIVTDIVWLLVSLYIIGMALQYWAAQTYKNGLTFKEIFLTFLWPLDVLLKLRAGAKLHHSFGMLNNNTQKGHALFGQTTAVIGGLLVSLMAAALLMSSISTAFHLFNKVVWLLVALYVLGTIVQYWAAQTYKNGLTFKEIFLTFLWPLGALKVIRRTT